MIVAIQSDDHPWPRGSGEHPSAPHWAEALEAAGHEVRWVDVYRADILDQLRGCDGFMWRFHQVPDMAQIAHRLLPVVERDLGLQVYPDQATCWHYDDKVAQAYLFQAHGIPSPQTWVWHDREGALAWARTARYPMVAKLAAGAGSNNVQLVGSVSEAQQYIRLLFDSGVHELNQARPRGWTARRRALVGAVRSLGRAVRAGAPSETYWQAHRNYVYFQEFLAANEFDTRVTVIGDRVFAFRRFNREGDFRASGSGSIDWDPAAIDPAFVRLALVTASALGTQSCAIDGLYRGAEPVLCEVSYTYASWAVHDCPGHWRLEGADPAGGQLAWHSGKMRPERAQAEDFIERLERRAGTARLAASA